MHFQNALYIDCQLVSLPPLKTHQIFANLTGAIAVGHGWGSAAIAVAD